MEQGRDDDQPHAESRLEWEEQRLEGGWGFDGGKIQRAEGDRAV